MKESAELGERESQGIKPFVPDSRPPLLAMHWQEPDILCSLCHMIQLPLVTCNRGLIGVPIPKLDALMIAFMLRFSSQKDNQPTKDLVNTEEGQDWHHQLRRLCFVIQFKPNFGNAKIFGAHIFALHGADKISALCWPPCLLDADWKLISLWTRNPFHKK